MPAKLLKMDQSNFLKIKYGCQNNFSFRKKENEPLKNKNKKTPQG